MLHRRPGRAPRPRPALSAVLAALALLPIACMSVTPPPATQPPAATPAVSSTPAVPAVRSPVSATPVLATPPPAATQSPTQSPTPLLAASPAAPATDDPAVSPGSVAVGLTVTPELAARLDGILDQWKKDAQVPGVVAALRMPDGTVWYGASGKAILPPGRREGDRRHPLGHRQHHQDIRGGARLPAPARGEAVAG